MHIGFPLSATSAMVLLWCKDQSFPSPWSKQFLAQLDLSAGRPMVEEFNRRWSVAAEGVLDRKFTIHQQALEFLKENRRAQVVILGAGLSATCLELKSHFSDISIYELDRDLMDVKARLLETLPQEARRNLHLVQVDLMDVGDVARKMAATPWREDLPTLIIAEGISYYLTESALWSLFDLFRKKSSSTRVLLEYLLPSEGIWPPFAKMVDQGFDYLTQICNLSFVTRYDRPKVLEHAAKLGATVRRTTTMRQGERDRLGKNIVMEHPQSSWLEIAEIEIPR